MIKQKKSLIFILRNLNFFYDNTKKLLYHLIHKMKMTLIKNRHKQAKKCVEI